MTIQSQAIWMAATKHNGQKDKGGTDYICHCIEVMISLNSDDEELNAIAVLHDILEDTDTTVDELRTLFTERIISAVVLLTKTRDNRRTYLEDIKKNEDALLVKMADLSHNMQLSRLKEVTVSDILRVEKYYVQYHQLRRTLYEY